MPDIELEPAKFRPVFTKPLAKPAVLWLGIAVSGAATALAVWGVTYKPDVWSGVLVVPPAVLLGVAIAGLLPGYFFRDPT